MRNYSYFSTNLDSISRNYRHESRVIYRVWQKLTTGWKFVSFSTGKRANGIEIQIPTFSLSLGCWKILDSRVSIDGTSIGITQGWKWEN